jgi:hypothetical protein
MRRFSTRVLYMAFLAVAVVLAATSCEEAGNHAPLVFSVRASETTAAVGTEISLVVDAVDIDEQSLTYVYAVTAGDVAITGTGPAAAAVLRSVGQHTVTVTVTDGWGSHGEAEVRLTGVSACAVTYHPNGATGGSVPSLPTTYAAGDTVTVGGNDGELTRRNRVFDGWNTKSDGSGTSYSPGASLAVTAPLALYAQWEWESYEVGERGPAGGYIFYINRYAEEDDWKYLEAAPASTEWRDREWGQFSVYIPDAHQTAIGTGESNTAAIVAVQGAGSTYAAQLCDALVVENKWGETYDDWFLPSIDELSEMVAQLYRATPALGQLFDGGIYWSSSVADSGPNIYMQIMSKHNDVVPLSSSAIGNYGVRAVRAF